MMVGTDQVTTIQTAHRMGDDVDRALELPVADCVSEPARALLAAPDRLHGRKQNIVLAAEPLLDAVEIVDDRKPLRKPKTAREDEIHVSPDRKSTRLNPSHA